MALHRRFLLGIKHSSGPRSRYFDRFEQERDSYILLSSHVQKGPSGALAHLQSTPCFVNCKVNNSVHLTQRIHNTRIEITFREDSQI